METTPEEQGNLVILEKNVKNKELYKTQRELTISITIYMNIWCKKPPYDFEFYRVCSSILSFGWQSMKGL